jgi:hypothetical protein
MKVVDEEMISVQEQINTTLAEIQETVREIKEVKNDMDNVVLKITNVKIKMATATSEKQLDRLAEDMRQLEEDMRQLEEDTAQLETRNAQLREGEKQLRESEKLLRDENELLLSGKTPRWNIAMTAQNKSEFTVGCFDSHFQFNRFQLSAHTHALSSDPKGHWDLSSIRNLQRRSNPLESAHTVEFLGREMACTVIGRVASSNFLNRVNSCHGGFSFLVASGHVLSGKTRTGMETPRLVDEMCAEVSLASTEVNFVDTVYLQIDFLGNARFDPQFDVEGMDVSVTLGSRLMNAFYEHVTLKEIRHDVALHHIITTVLADGETDSNTVVPLVIHFDDHIHFINAMDKQREKAVGQYYFEEMFRKIGLAATSRENPLCNLRSKGRYFIVGISTSTPLEDSTSFRMLGQFALHEISLPVLDRPNSQNLAIEFLSLRRRPSWSDVQLDTILSDSLFHMALAATAGIPGLIHFLCETTFGASYVEYLKFRVTAYIATHDWSDEWDSLTTIALARPHLVMEETSVVEGTYTLPDALDRRV